MVVEISADPKIWGIMTSGPKESADINARLFVNFHQKIWVIFDTRSPFDPIGAFLRVGKNF
jgi:hypothetical protein